MVRLWYKIEKNTAVVDSPSLVEQSKLKIVDRKVVQCQENSELQSISKAWWLSPSHPKDN